MSANSFVEYVILIYAGGIITTIIGFADLDTAVNALHENCQSHSADWGYAYKGDGSVIAHYQKQ